MCLKNLQNTIIKVLAIAVISFGVPIYLANNFLWSEPLFNVCVIALFYLFTLPTLNKKQWLSIIILCNLMILMRHAGLFILVGLFVARFLFLENRSVWRKYLFLLLLCSLGSVIWFVFAPSSGADWTKTIISVNLFQKIAHNFQMLSHGFSSWFLPMAIPLTLRVIGAVLILAILALWVKKNSSLNRADYIWLLASLIYVGCLHGVYEMPVEDGERYFSPLYPMLFIVFFRIFDRMLSSLETTKKKYAIIVVLYCWSIYPMYRTFSNAYFWHSLRCQEKVHGSNGIG
ncbi:MAG: hypothetical protein AAFN93_12090 [Bacteroidota bacterium]